MWIGIAHPLQLTVCFELVILCMLDLESRESQLSLCNWSLKKPEQFMFTLSRVLFLYNCKNIADRRAGYLGTIYVMFAKVVQ